VDRGILGEWQVAFATSPFLIGTRRRATPPRTATHTAQHPATFVFGIAGGTTLALRRIPDFPDDILERCVARGFFGGADLGILFGLVVAGVIGVLGRRSQRFQVPAVTAGAVIGLLTGGVVAALLLMELSTIKTHWRESVPYSDSVINTVAVYALMIVVGALTGAVFGYALAGVIRYRQWFPRNIFVVVPLIAASG
jgi:hypothetical protein